MRNTVYGEVSFVFFIWLCYLSKLSLNCFFWVFFVVLSSFGTRDAPFNFHVGLLGQWFTCDFGLK